MTDQVRVLESLSVSMKPVRLEFAKLKKKLDSAGDKLDQVRMLSTNSMDNKGADTAQICLENQVQFFSRIFASIVFFPLLVICLKVTPSHKSVVLPEKEHENVSKNHSQVT